MFAMYANAGNHHGSGRKDSSLPHRRARDLKPRACGRHAVWIKATAANQDFLARSVADRFFVPAYMGPSGWIGVYLHRDVVWDEVEDLLGAGYRLAAP